MISTSGTDIENQERWLMVQLVLIIVLISNLLANALRKYYGKKVK
jgi:phosphate transport system permease protein